MAPNNFNNTMITASFIQSLACAVLNPGLRSILVFDAPYAGLTSLATLLSQMLECTTGEAVKQIQLGALEQDDDLWGSLALRLEKNQSSTIVQVPGPLTAIDNSTSLVVISDLTRISLAVARACVMLMGADVAHLERQGHQMRWRPNICWLASCPRSEIGSISPHLLDRLALRLNWTGSFSPNNVMRLLKQIQQDMPKDDTTNIPLSEEIKVNVQKAVSLRATMTDEALEQILFHSSHMPVFTPRREIALVRQATAIAQFEGSNQVTVQHVEVAAYLTGLVSSPPEPQEEHSLLPQAEEQLEKDTQHFTQLITNTEGVDDKDTQEAFTSFETVVEQTNLMKFDEPIYAPDQLIIVEKMALPVEPYPEDKAPVAREAGSLRLPLHQHTSARTGHGPIIGVERTDRLQDLAVTSTLLAAIPYQPIRRKHCQCNSNRLLLSVNDLRGYRREPLAELMLLLLIDYTSLSESAWQEALLPFLRKAYVERASISIIQVGAANVRHELRAELVSAHSILVPRVEAALNSLAGRATPLAHGFNIALNTLRHVLQHGCSTVQQALFVVISDGRGNVPIEMSRTGQITAPVNREGIEDTLRMAQLIRMLKRVQVFYLNPQPIQYQDLPLTLAQALNASLVPIHRSQTKEV